MPDDDIRVPKHLYDDLINAATSLATVSANAVATILEGTPYESMLRGPAEALKAALEVVPGAANWDGAWREEDVEYQSFRHHSQPDRSGADAGIKAIHKPTGISVESYMKPTPIQNEASAARALKDRVRRYAAEQGLT